MTYDDLKPTSICQFKSPFPAVDPREIHIVMWRSRPVRSDTCFHSVPAVHSSAVSTPATAIVSVPATAAITASTPPISAHAADSNQLLTVCENLERQVKEASDVFCLWPPVIAGALRHRVLTAFC